MIATCGWPSSSRRFVGRVRTGACWTGRFDEWMREGERVMKEMRVCICSDLPSIYIFIVLSVYAESKPIFSLDLIDYFACLLARLNALRCAACFQLDE